MDKVQVMFLKGNKVRLTFSKEMIKDDLSLISETIKPIASATNKGNTIMLTDRKSFDMLVENKVLLF